MIDGTGVLTDYSDFKRLAKPGRIVPVAVEIPFDLDTPVTAFSKLRRGRSPVSGSGAESPAFSFLLESVEGGERWARYTFLGADPREAWRLDGSEIRLWTRENGWGEPEVTSDPFAAFEAWLNRFEPVSIPALPRFWGGAVGYFAYDAVRWLEHLPDSPGDDLGVPDAYFMATERVLIMDTLYSRAFAVAAVRISHAEDAEQELAQLYEDSLAGLAEWVDKLNEPHDLQPLPLPARRSGNEVSQPRDQRSQPRDQMSQEEGGQGEEASAADLVPAEMALVGNRSRQDYEAAVERVRDYIAAGDAYQVVVSRRLGSTFDGDPLGLYRDLRRRNPSPYLFFIELDDVRLIGSSPETLVRVEDGGVTVRPIAGTRPRGGTPGEDGALATELLADKKERAEHLMLVDLGRNDVSRVARAGSVEVSRFMEVERYSHVMHLVSEVSGRLREGLTAIDGFRACFPAGTLTGAPKVRAMEIIDELEPTRRGPYGGAAGYAGYGSRCLDMAIVIRTLLIAGNRVYVQAGAGVVYDSSPEKEWLETGDKARVLLRALEDAGCRG